MESRIFERFGDLIRRMVINHANFCFTAEKSALASHRLLSGVHIAGFSLLDVFGWDFGDNVAECRSQFMYENNAQISALATPRVILL